MFFYIISILRHFIFKALYFYNILIVLHSILKLFSFRLIFIYFFLGSSVKFSLNSLETKNVFIDTFKNTINNNSLSKWGFQGVEYRPLSFHRMSR